MAQGFSNNSGIALPLAVASGGTGLTSSKAVIQRVYTQTGTMATGTTSIPLDNTIPQNTEGTEFMTLAITPKSSSNILEIRVLCQLACATDPYMIMALFQDSTASALATVHTYPTSSTTTVVPITLTHSMTAGTTSSTTFKIRAGQYSGNTVTFNGYGGGSYFNGTQCSGIIITEYAP
jgi:hypothetical protein